tara:strand:- start:6952 stop:7176 length:225 start_codon:yes stop_codon:yes gene_type:complete
MKYVIILYLCSFANVPPSCFSERVVALEFETYNACILEGYKQAYVHLENINDDKVEEEKLAIKFQCKEIKTENI